MKKHLLRLFALAALLLPLATNAQIVSGCAYTTGVDTSKWITLSSSATEITAIYDDDSPSSCINIGFGFYFGGNTYTQFSCNSNGRFRLGSTAVSNYWTGPFTTLTSADYNDLPFVTAFGADNTLAGTGVYVKYELVGTAPNRILVVEYLTPSQYDEEGDLVNYQIQLLEDSNRVRLVYGATAASYYDDYQIGIAGTATDFLMVNATTHATLTTPTSFTNSDWPGVGRYYEFTMGMPPACPAITSITAGQVTVGSAAISWTYGSGNPISYEVQYHPQGSTATPLTLTTTAPNAVITGLDSNTTYVVSVRAYCGTDGYGAWDSTTFTTASFGCAGYDPASTHTFTSGTGTSQTSGVPVNSSWGNTLCQGIYTAAELIAAGFPSTGADITDLTFTWTNNSSYAKYFTIYMVNTTKDVFGGTTATEWVPTGASAKVYEGAHPLNTSGAVTYHLTTPFHWDGTSNICVTTTMNQPSGASHSSSSFYGYSTTLSSYYRTLYKYQDSSPLDGANPAATAASSRSYYRTNITFLSQTCTGLATCAAPVIWIDSMTAYEAYLSWIPGFNETSWDVQYRVKGTTAWTTATTGATTTTATVSSLTPGTHYEFRVVTVCTSETHPSNIEEGTTECVPIAHTALPFTYGFEDLTSTGSGTPIGNCWARGYYTGSYNANSYPYAQTTYHTGSRSLYFYSYSTTTCSWLCLPEFADSINTLNLQFWAKKSSTSYTGMIKVGVMTDPTDYNTFQLVRTDYTDATTDWNHFDVSLANAPATGRITIMVEAGVSGSYNYIYLDDITVNELPYCTTPVVDSVLVTSSSADLYLSDVAHATGITVTLTAGTWSQTYTDTGSVITLTSLTAGTTYNYSIVAACGSSDVSSTRTGSFTTECEPIPNTALPFTDGFEDLTTTGSGSPLAPCWDRGYYSGSYNANSYPYSSSSYYHTGSRSLYFYSYSTTTRSWLCLPEFADSVNTLDLQFWAMKSSTSYSGMIKIGVMTDPTNYNTFQTVRTVYTDATTSWNHFDVSLSNAPAAGRITIMVEAGASGSYNYIYLDDITVNELPYCTTPVVDSMLVTTNSATLYLGDVAHAEDFTVTLTAGSWTHIYTDTSAVITLTGLAAGTTYTYSIVATCGGTEISSTSNGTFTTECEPIPHTALPFEYGFEDITSTGSGIPLPNCWDRGYLSGSTFNAMNYPYASSSYYHTGTRSLYFYGSGTTTRSWLCLPEFADSINTLQISFWGRKTSTSYNGRIIVGVMTDPHTFATFQPVDTVTIDNTTSFVHFEVPLNNAPGTGYITIMDLPGSGTNYFYLDDIHVDVIPTCLTPSGLTASNITLSTADLSWHTRLGTETAWLVGNGRYEVVATDTNFTIMGLAPSSTNTVTVRALCGDGDTSEMAYITVTTPCGLVPPFLEDFESQTTTSSTSNTFIPCWHHLNNGTSYPGYPYLSSSSTYNHTHGGTKGLYWYGSTTTGTYGDYYYLVLPMLDTANYQMSNMRVKFWAKASSTSYHPIVRVGVMTDPTNVNTFQAVNSNIAINPGSSTAWAEFTVDLTSYTGTGAYIAIGAVRPTSSWYMYMDDISVIEIPDCDGVSNLHLAGVTTTSATLDWTPTGNESSWTVEYGAHGFYPSTGTTVTVNSHPYTITGLNVSSQYDVYVTPACTGSAETVSYTFRTECNPLDTLPYTMCFETSDGVTTTGSSTSDVFVDCWHRLNNGTQYFGYPYVASSTTYNHTTGGSRGLYWYNYSNTESGYGSYQIIVLPAVDTTVIDLSEHMLMLYAKASSTSYYPAFQVGIMTNPLDPSTFQQVGTINVSNSTAWDRYDVSFENFTGYGSYVAIRAVTGTSWYAYVDDITLKHLPDCPRVTNMAASNIGTSQADLTWTENGTASFWSIEYGPHGFTPGSSAGTTEVVYSLPHTIYGLTANTEYDVYIMPDCTGEYEINSFTFRTECVAMSTLPYTYGFEGLATGSNTVRPVINCWHHLNNGTQYYGYPYVTSTAHTGTRALYWYNPSSSGTYGDYQCVVLPAIDTDTYPINTLQLKFWAKASSSSYSPVFHVGVMSDPNDVTTFQNVQTINVGSSAEWEEFVTGFANFTGYGQYIAVNVPRAGSYWYAYTDDFTIEEAPECPPIASMDVEAVGTTGAFVTWDYQPGTIGTPQEYDIEYYEVGGSGTVVSLTDTLPSVFITGLDTNTTYCVRVRANCYEYDYGVWDSITFTTVGLGCAAYDPTSTYTLTLNSGTASTSYYIPLNNFYNYTYTQQIVLASELQGAGSITDIEFQYNYSTASTAKTNCTIYLANVSESTLTSGFVPYSSAFQMVYTGPLNCSNGWNTFSFTEPFDYDGASNLLIVVHDNSGSYNSSSYTFNTHSTTTTRARYLYNDGSAYNINTVSGGTSYSYMNNMKLHFTSCAQEASCGAPMVRATHVEGTFANIEWSAGLDETSWDVDYRVANATTWTSAEIGTSNMGTTLLNLNPATTYEVRVSHYCASDDTTYYGFTEFTTPCVPYSVPFTENFDSYVASQNTQLGPCWFKHHTYSSYSYAPYVTSSYAHSGSNSLYFYYGYSDSYCDYLVLPEMADSIRSLELSFWEYKTSASYGLVEIGVMTDPTDLSTFVPVDTVQAQATSTWEQFYVNFTNYQGPEGRIAMVSRTSSSYYFYIDDIEVGRYSTCPRVQALATTRVTNDSAYISWSGDSANMGYRVWWSTTDNLNTAPDSIDLTTPNLGLGPFGPNVTVYAWVAQFCDDGVMSSPVRISFTTAANCEVISDLYIHNVTATSAVFTWNGPEAGYPATSYRVSWQTPTGMVYDTTPNPFYFLMGLDTASSYTFSVQALCSHSGEDDSSYWVSRTFTTHTAQCNYISGLGTSTSTSSAPLYTSRAYEYTHMLFFVDELAQMGDTITSLTFNVTTSGSITRNVDVYLGNSDYENLYTPVFPPLSTLTQVYSGNWTVTNGQCTLTFTTPFVRDHSRNLVVGVDDNTGSTGSSFSFSAAYTTDANTGDYIYSVHYAGGDADVNPAVDQAVNVTYVRPIITFGTTCASENCSSPAAIAANPTDTSINVYWNANSGTSWQVEYRLPTDTVWTLAATNITTPQYTIGGLRPATRYAIRVGSICSPSHILYTPIFSATACGDALLPYTDDFDDIVNGWLERPCWRVGTGTGAARIESSTASNYPRVVNLTQYGPMMRLYDGAFAVLPHFAEPLNNLQVRFLYHTGFTTDAWCIFGYLTNPNDINSLVVIDTLRHHPTIEGPRLYTIDLDQLADDADGNLVFYTPHTLNYTHIDEIVVDLIPPCAIPDSLRLISAIDTAADLTWYMSNIGSATYMVRYTAYRSGVYDTVYCSGTSISLTGLTPGTTYDAECYSICLRTGDTSLASNVCRFTTDCAPLPTLPYNMTFENIPLSSTQTLPNCWEIPYTTTTIADNLPHCVFDNPNAAGGYYYVLIASESAIAMPQFVAPPDSLQISFYLKTAAAGESVVVGVIDTMVPFAFTPIDTFTTATTGYEFFSAYMVGYTGPGERIGIVTLNSNTVYIDNLVIDYAPTCLPVRSFHVDTVTESSVTLAWRNLTAASQYEVEYGAPGFIRGTGTTVTVTTNPAIIRGLTPMTNYDFYIRPICSVGDTGEWSSSCRAATALCQNLVTANSWDSTWTLTSSSYAPIGYSLYNYSYVQTIIDSARFAEVEAEISAFAFNPTVSTAGSYYNHIDIYMANVSENNLSAGFIMPDANHQFVQVMNDRDLSYSTVGWQMFSFDTAFTWDGHSNVLFVVNRRHGTYTSGATFSAHSTSTVKTRYLYQDAAAYDPNTVSATGGYTLNLVGDLQFFSCAASCDRPSIDSVNGDYQSATITWVGTGNNYQVSYRTADDTNWTTPVAVVGNTYTFTNLQPLTNYELRVRQDCTADSIGFSAWMATLFRTDSLPCYAPDTLAVLGTTNSTVTLGWIPGGDETAWDIHVWNATYDSIYTVTTNPATIGGFMPGVTYNAAVRARCGLSAGILGDYSDTVQFTAATCGDVTGLTIGTVTHNSVSLSWNAVTGAQGYRVAYIAGQYHDTITTTATNHTFYSLPSDLLCTLFVQTVCGAGWYSENWAVDTVTTLEEPDSTFTITVGANNPAFGSVTGGGSYVPGTTVVLTAIPNTGYHFVTWQDGDTNNPRTITVTANATYTATFAINTYTVTVTSANPTMGNATGTGTYNHGDTATLVATANPGYHFVSWSDGDTNATRQMVVTSNLTFSASFAANQYTITVTANDPSMGSVTGGGMYYYGDTATLVATANTGYGFRGWSDGNTSNPRYLLVTGNITLQANFSDDTTAITEYTVTLTVNDPTMGSLSTYGGQYAEGTNLTVTATANAGYHFVNWSDDNTDNPRTFTVNSDITMQANFAQDVDSTAVLTVSVNDAAMGYVTINGNTTSTYRGRLGDQVDLAAVANDGYVFVSWSDGETSATRTYTLTENTAELTATFRQGEGIADVTTASCTLYPNPAKGATTVSVTGISGKVRIAVLDLTGREVVSETVECSADCEKTLDIEGLAEGAYFVRITSEAAAPMVKKLIVR